VIDVEQLYRDHADDLCRALRRRFRRTSVPDALIEDACAQAWAIAWDCREDIEPDNPLGWLIVVALHEVYALLRKRRREAGGELVATGIDAGAQADPELALEAREALRALRALKPQQCEALALRAAGYRYEEIVELTGRTYTWVNRHVSEGKRALRAATSSQERSHPLRGGSS
jgi:RNA polymerase sigma factor (sigma-70 family)